MQQALDLRNCLIMMDKGMIILDVPEEEKKLTVERLLSEFQRLRGEKFAGDRAVQA
jgi:putative ABC transport system ATP-binding protein